MTEQPHFLPRGDQGHITAFTRVVETDLPPGPDGLPAVIGGQTVIAIRAGLPRPARRAAIRAALTEARRSRLLAFPILAWTWLRHMPLPHLLAGLGATGAAAAAATFALAPPATGPHAVHGPGYQPAAGSLPSAASSPAGSRQRQGAGGAGKAGPALAGRAAATPGSGSSGLLPGVKVTAPSVPVPGVTTPAVPVPLPTVTTPALPVPPPSPKATVPAAPSPPVTTPPLPSPPVTTPPLPSPSPTVKVKVCVQWLLGVCIKWKITG